MVETVAPLEFRAQCNCPEGSRSGCGTDFPVVTLKQRFKHKALGPWLFCIPNKFPRPPPAAGGGLRMTREAPVVKLAHFCSIWTDRPVLVAPAADVGGREGGREAGRQAVTK